MARKPTLERPRSAAVARTGFEKMQMSHRRMQKQIQRIKAEAAERTATGKPLHGGAVTRR
jgi:hypothetical protein